MFSVDKALICARSQFIRDALDGSPENEDKVVNFFGLPRVFETYLSLVHTGKIACQDVDDYNKSYESAEKSNVSVNGHFMDENADNLEQAMQFSRLVDLYVLSKRLMDFKAIQTTMEGLLEVAKDGRCFHDTVVIMSAIEETHEDDQLRPWLVDIVVESFPDMLYDLEQDNLPNDFWYEAAQRMAAHCKIIPEGARRWEDISRYIKKIKAS